MTAAVVVCAGCGLAGHARAACPDRQILRIPAFVDTDPIPFEIPPNVELGLRVSRRIRAAELRCSP